MPELTDLSYVRALCEKYDFALSKGFGGDTVIHGKMPRQCQPHLSGTHDDDSHILTSFNFLTGCPPAF